jgi:hypothetical protein
LCAATCIAADVEPVPHDRDDIVVVFRNSASERAVVLSHLVQISHREDADHVFNG